MIYLFSHTAVRNLPIFINHAVSEDVKSQGELMSLLIMAILDALNLEQYGITFRDIFMVNIYRDLIDITYLIDNKQKKIFIEYDPGTLEQLTPENLENMRTAGSFEFGNLLSIPEKHQVITMAKLFSQEKELLLASNLISPYIIVEERKTPILNEELFRTFVNHIIGHLGLKNVLCVIMDRSKISIIQRYEDQYDQISIDWQIEDWTTLTSENLNNWLEHNKFSKPNSMTVRKDHEKVGNAAKATKNDSLAKKHSISIEIRGNLEQSQMQFLAPLIWNIIDKLELKKNSITLGPIKRICLTEDKICMYVEKNQDKLVPIMISWNSKNQLNLHNTQNISVMENSKLHIQNLPITIHLSIEENRSVLYTSHLIQKEPFPIEINCSHLLNILPKQDLVRHMINTIIRQLNIPAQQVQIVKYGCGCITVEFVLNDRVRKFGIQINDITLLTKDNIHQWKMDDIWNSTDFTSSIYLFSDFPYIAKIKIHDEYIEWQSRIVTLIVEDKN